MLLTTAMNVGDQVTERQMFSAMNIFSKMMGVDAHQAAIYLRDAAVSFMDNRELMARTLSNLRAMAFLKENCDKQTRIVIANGIFEICHSEGDPNYSQEHFLKSLLGGLDLKPEDLEGTLGIHNYTVERQFDVEQLEDLALLFVGTVWILRKSDVSKLASVGIFADTAGIDFAKAADLLAKGEGKLREQLSNPPGLLNLYDSSKDRLSMSCASGDLVKIYKALMRVVEADGEASPEALLIFRGIQLRFGLADEELSK